MEDASRILAGVWLCLKGILMLKRWTQHFDPHKENIHFRCLWVLLSGLLIEFWNWDVFAAIGNDLGHFLIVDKKCLGVEDKRVGKVLVELDMFKGLRDEMEIEWHERVYTQKLDYWGILF